MSKPLVLNRAQLLEAVVNAFPPPKPNPMPGGTPGQPPPQQPGQPPAGGPPQPGMAPAAPPAPAPADMEAKVKATVKVLDENEPPKPAGGMSKLRPGQPLNPLRSMLQGRPQPGQLPPQTPGGGELPPAENEADMEPVLDADGKEIR